MNEFAIGEKVQSWAPSLPDTLLPPILAAEGASQAPWKRSQQHAFAAKANPLLGCVSGQQSRGREPSSPLSTRGWSNLLQLDLLRAGPPEIPPTYRRIIQRRSSQPAHAWGGRTISNLQQDRHLPGLCNRYKSWCVHARKGTRRGNRVTEENSNSGSKLSSWDLTDVCRGKKVWSRPRGRLMWGGDGNNY